MRLLKCSRILGKKISSVGTILILLAILSAGCRAGGSTVSVPLPEVETATREQPFEPFSPYAFATSEAGFSSLHGWLVVLDPLIALPEEDGIVLVPIDGLNEADSMIPEFDVDEVKRAEVDERNGEFLFSNLQPGRYIIMILTLNGSRVPVHVLGGSELAIVHIEENQIDQTIELGELRVP
jgi:hypothetical protein